MDLLSILRYFCFITAAYRLVASSSTWQLATFGAYRRAPPPPLSSEPAAQAVPSLAPFHLGPAPSSITSDRTRRTAAPPYLSSRDRLLPSPLPPLPHSIPFLLTRWGNHVSHLFVRAPYIDFRAARQPIGAQNAAVASRLYRFPPLFLLTWAFPPFLAEAGQAGVTWRSRPESPKVIAPLAGGAARPFRAELPHRWFHLTNGHQAELPAGNPFLQYHCFF